MLEELDQNVQVQLEQNLKKLLFKNFSNISNPKASSEEPDGLESKKTVLKDDWLDSLDNHFFLLMHAATKTGVIEINDSNDKKTILQANYLLPSLILYTNGAVEGQPEKLLKITTAVEFLLKASCLLDDIQDGDKNRSLLGTTGVGEALNIALILMSLGHELLNDSIHEFTLLSQEAQDTRNTSDIISTFSKLSKRLFHCIQFAARGQLLDVQEKDVSPGRLFEQPDYHMQKIGLKTALITSYLAELGATLAAPFAKEAILIYRQFGFTFGKALHLVNDLQDFLTATNHKVENSRDLGQGQITLPLVYAYQGLNTESERQHLLKLWEQIGCSTDTTSKVGLLKELSEMLRSTPAFLQTVMLLMDSFFEAENQLKRLDPLLEKTEHRIMLEILKKLVMRFQGHCSLRVSHS